MALEVEEEFTLGDEVHRLCRAPGSDTLLFLAEPGPRRPAKGWRSLAEPEEPGVFTLSFIRSFVLCDGQDEYLGTDELALTIEFPDSGAWQGVPHDRLEASGERGRRAAEAWFAQVSASPAFAGAFARGVPEKFYFDYGRV